MFQAIVYHLIENPEKCMSLQEKRMFVSRKRFTSHLKTLQKHGYTFLTLKEAEERLLEEVASSSKEVLITFDDGYVNTVDVAMPILKREGIPATMAICGSYLLPETRKNIDMHIDKNFADVEGIKKWIDNGNSILAHTYSHFKLTRLTLDKCEQEVILDLKTIKKYLDIKPEGIVYPYGSVNDEVISVIKRYFKYAFATNIGKEISKNNKYCLKRICVESNCSDEKLIEMLYLNGNGDKNENSNVLA